MTRAEVLEILRSGTFEPLRGMAETIGVEFKGEPYQFADRDNDKFELAKDVSALANASGGVIVIGARTERDNEAAVDVVSELRPLQRGLVNEAQYEAVLSDMVYPRLGAVAVCFHPSAEDDDRREHPLRERGTRLDRLRSVPGAALDAIRACRAVARFSTLLARTLDLPRLEDDHRRTKYQR